METILSGDYPRSRLLTALLGLLLAVLAAAPFLFDGAQAINTAAKICVFVVLVASYDLLLGYTGIVSFAHTMFYGLGGYGVGLALYSWGPSWGAVAGGLALALAAGVLLALGIGLFSLRVRAIFFAMITLAVASAFAVLAAQLSDVTGGEDGRSFRVPELLRPGFRLVAEPVLGTTINGRVVTYYIVFASALLLFLAALRVVNSPFGRVLQAIRENEFRAEALGYRTVCYRTAANCLAAGMAVLAGALNALWLRYTGPETTLSFTIMLDILLMVVIGGMGTLYGAAIGASLLILAQSYLQKLMAVAAQATEGLPLLPQLLHPDRWLLWLGVLFVTSVYFFPSGIVGRLRAASR
ncbi:branched-chain amino acid ABC transporter permease [Chelatococcus sp. SYSU_G07232]|uniref:Branched-chain amino acid ABC transporter permease n=1 Tax=Chelatococcus albus TaxID=3047466 RepID=A0ABT7AKZ1_9HYPH|nr:branched-chain amino acid ABC transporter permease [Chelatococcus sp. SYSU_G07232]MDJ1160048.1 branched-chain amino acid ABC transporter permease [Chelatococcus sp. SYSU_G07232]